MNFTVPVPIFLTSSILVTLHLTEERPKLMLSGRVTCGVIMQMRAEYNFALKALSVKQAFGLECVKALSVKSNHTKDTENNG